MPLALFLFVLHALPHGVLLGGSVLGPSLLSWLSKETAQSQGVAGQLAQSQRTVRPSIESLPTLWLLWLQAGSLAALWLPAEPEEVGK